jgi:Fe2+ or Zn2+ uptake regulation protein
MDSEKSRDFLLKDTKLQSLVKELFDKYQTRNFDADEVLATLPKVRSRAQADDQVDSFYNNLQTLVDLGFLTSEGGRNYCLTLRAAEFLDSLEEGF